MNDFNNYETIEKKQLENSIITGFMTKVYGWMCFALLITAMISWVVAHSEIAINFIFGNSYVLWGLFIAELVLVIAISSAINRISVSLASFLFVLYSLLTGATLSVIFLVYTNESIASTFVVTAATFGVMSLYGFITKRDLTKLGNILMMALFGLIIASVVNLFWANSSLYWITTYAGVLIFVGLTAYDTQKLKRMSLQIEDQQMAAKWSILGALTLYLDFINLFLYLLRFLGRRK